MRGARLGDNRTLSVMNTRECIFYSRLVVNTSPGHTRDTTRHAVGAHVLSYNTISADVLFS